MALTILTLSSGFIGGEVAPLFSIGSCLGYVLGPVFGFDPMFGAALDSLPCSAVDQILCLQLSWSAWKVSDIICSHSFRLYVLYRFIFNFNNSIFTAQRVAFTHLCTRQRLKQQIA